MAGMCVAWQVCAVALDVMRSARPSRMKTSLHAMEGGSDLDMNHEQKSQEVRVHCHMMSTFI